MNRMTDKAILIDAWLANDHAAFDPELPSLLDLLNQRRAGQSWHKHGSFREHLTGVYRMLKLWGQDRETCLCGLFHSVYSNEFVDLALFDPKEGRSVLAEKLGPDMEATIHLFCVMPRTAFVLELLQRDSLPEDGLTLSGPKGEPCHLTRRQIAMFLIVTLADLMEQWYSWQEDTMSDFPYTGRDPADVHWAASLWPGPFRPGTSAMHLASKLARHLPALGLPVPSVFADCTVVLSRADETAASALYWQVASQNIPLLHSQHAQHILEQAIAHNPWVGEPHLMLAQIHMVANRFDDAARHAQQGLALLTDWGVQWDKRVSWEGWIIWAHVLIQKSAQKVWPSTLREFNSLGFVAPCA